MIGKDVCALANFITRYQLTKKEIHKLNTYSKYVDFVLDNDPYKIRITATYDKDTGHFTIYDIWWLHSWWIDSNSTDRNIANRSEADEAIKKFIKTHYPQLYNDAINIGGLTYLNLSNHDDGD